VVSPFNDNLIEVVPQITVEMLSDDAKEVLNGTKTVAQIDALDDNAEEVPNNNIVSMITRQNILHLYPLWDRSNVYITSSISSTIPRLALSIVLASLPTVEGNRRNLG